MSPDVYLGLESQTPEQIVNDPECFVGDYPDQSGLYHSGRFGDVHITIPDNSPHSITVGLPTARAEATIHRDGESGVGVAILPDLKRKIVVTNSKSTQT